MRVVHLTLFIFSAVSFPGFLFAEEELRLPFPEEFAIEPSEKEAPDNKALEEVKEKPKAVANPSPKKKKKKGDGEDPSLAPYLKAKALLSRKKETEAEASFKESASQAGESTNKARTDASQLLALQSKDSEASGLVSQIEEPEAKTKAQFELARSLEKIGNADSQEKAYLEYIKLTTSFPIHPDLTPRSHLAIAVLLFRKREVRPGLHHCMTVIQSFPDSSSVPLAIFYSAKLYELPGEEKSSSRAISYYKMYLQKTEGKEIPAGQDYRNEAKSRLKFLGTI